MKNYCVDVETLDNQPSCVILSAAICWFDYDECISYEDYVKRTLYVKFDMSEQLALGRTKGRDTIEWWKKQGKDIQKLCLFPSPHDVQSVYGIHLIKDYVKTTGGSDRSFFWARGTLDQTSLDSLCKAIEENPIATYNQWMDIRTAIRLTKETSTWAGYCDVPDLPERDRISKHNPIDDVILDIFMLTRGK